MTQALQLIAGLGNPGPEYDQTRHNAGFWFLDELARRHGGRFRTEARFTGEVCRVVIDGHQVWLLKPMTYMNRSGQSLRHFATFYKIPPEQILVAHDEIDLPPGTTRFKRGGGHGGHNGLRDIIAQLGKEFWRLRLGVGHPGHRDQVVDYVLSRPSKADRELIEADVVRAADLVDGMIRGDFERTMHRLHTV